MPTNATTYPTLLHPAPVHVGGIDMDRITYQGETVVTLAQIDRVHGRVDGTAGRVFRDNRDRFASPAEYIVANLDEIRRGFPRAFPARGGGEVILVTRRGYMKICKSLTDDLAWDVFDEMLDRYFAGHPAVAAFDPSDPAVLIAVLGSLHAQVAAKDQRIAELEPQAATLKQLTGSGGSVSLTDGGKVLGLKRKDFLVWLSVNDWLYRGQDSKWRANTARVESGHLEQIVQTYGPNEQYATVSVRVTVAGMAELNHLIDRALFTKVKKPKKAKLVADDALNAMVAHDATFR